ARIKAALRRLQKPGIADTPPVLTFKHIRIDTGSRQVTVMGELVDLTAIEFNLLLALAEHNNLVLSREQLLERMWGHDYFGEMRVVDVHIGHIRQKLGLPNMITTVRGVGYRFSDEVA
ncbi:MAG: response regulator transcription factor, partial [Anaerolineales bacterium]|nr:response regulator transcription factor [Anaerolineales bacterium]